MRCWLGQRTSRGKDELGMTSWESQRSGDDEGLHRNCSGLGGRDGDTALGRILGAVSLWSWEMKQGAGSQETKARRLGEGAPAGVLDLQAGGGQFRGGGRGFGGFFLRGAHNHWGPG